jgi:hypothetical protein
MSRGPGGGRSGNLGSWRPEIRRGRGDVATARLSAGVARGAAVGARARGRSEADPARYPGREGNALDLPARTPIDVALRRDGASCSRRLPSLNTHLPRRFASAAKAGKCYLCARIELLPLC